MKALNILVIAPKEESISLSEYTVEGTTEIESWYPESNDAKQTLLKILSFDRVEFAGDWQNDFYCALAHELAFTTNLLISSTQKILTNAG